MKTFEKHNKRESHAIVDFMFMNGRKPSSAEKREIQKQVSQEGWVYPKNLAGKKR